MSENVEGSPQKKILVANWKMNPSSLSDLENMLQEYIEEGKNREESDGDIWVAPPSLYIRKVAECFSDYFLVGAQDVSDEREGSRTGDICASMVQGEGASFTIVGHSERRAYHGEDDEKIAHKAMRAWEENLCVLLCVGETKQERESGMHGEIVRRQIRIALQNAPHERKNHIVIAYEPVWAVGSNVTPTVAEICEMRDEIRDELERSFENNGKNIPLLYGGSVTSENAWETIVAPAMDGALVGRAALDPKEFFAIGRACQEMES